MELKDVVIQAILERKGMFVKDYDCMDITPFMDDIIVVTANNLRQNNAIAQNIKEKVKEAGFDIPIRQEGDAHSPWILLDLGNVVVNLFVKETRQIYNLDRLYADCPVTSYDL
ncbi:MAG: ribosome silencing factor [Absicoccus sp.]|uniref:Ribosomal silencing factor RsfS n=1 Tax=Absicoccus intestinalis TaxID=2926319 RepID=A0ABU4WL54_9FIRM|nr:MULTISPECIES: ribosome silencing factor [unclassified Absicoccus]MDX8417289.1 ribosome silencing factor [Absicoccus sp. CLA-KB-P134]MDY3035591.1 ribosome silencing factor [Absicoccus sp.]